MSVMWKYLDKKDAAIQALEDFGDMQFIIENTPDEIKLAQDRMVSLGSPGMDGLPHAHNPKAGEDRLVEAIEKIDILKERYRQALEYMSWFKPAWEKLNDDERYVLEAFYSGNEYGSDAMGQVCRRLGVEQATAYRRRNHALDHLQLLLYGKI